MSDRQTVVQALNTCWTSLETLLADLSPDEWTTQSLCPDWTVHGVMSHLTAAEGALVGWLPESVDDMPFTTVMEVFDENLGLDSGTLAERFSAVTASRRADLSAVTDAEWALPSFSPVGPMTYGEFMAIRAFDFWVHERDITTPLGRPSDDGGRAAEVAFAQVHGSLGYIIGKRAGLPDGMSMAIHLSGALEQDAYVLVDGRAKVVDHVADPDVDLTADFLTFMQLACGRIDPEAAIADGRISWSGDEEAGSRAARNLRFTM